MKSHLIKIGRVQFPEHTGEKVYMLPFRKSGGLPSHLAHWQPTVDAMLQGIETEGELYLMIDQGTIKAGQTHRRGGPHIDGNWIASEGRHRGDPVLGGWKTGQWNDRMSTEALILASDVSACQAYLGEIDGLPLKGGDCSNLDLSGLTPVMLDAFTAYAGNVSLIHESVPVPTDCKRTVVRISAPGVVV